MKAFLRAYVYSYIAVVLTQAVLTSMYFGGDTVKTYLLVVLALTLVNFFMNPLLKLISLPTKGPGFIFLSFGLILIVLYITSLVIPSFAVVETTITQLKIFGIVLPSKSLTYFWSLVATAVLFNVVYNFFAWLNGESKI